ncbi:polyprotein [Neisseria gonorrhoeae]
MTRFICRPLPKNAKKMPSEGLSDGICGKTGRAGGSEEDFAPA